MAVVVVVGAQWGDEGKGKVVDLLTDKVQVVARWGGGANAGHTIVVDGRKHVTHLIPSGILRAGVTCVLGEGMVVDPRTLVGEIRTFRDGGYLASDNDLVVSERAHVTLPHHREIDRLREEQPGAIGSTRRGIGPTYESKAARIGVRIGDLLRPERFRKVLEASLQAWAPVLERLGAPAQDVRKIEEEHLGWGETLRPFVADASRFLFQQIRQGRNVLLEGAQGVLLDLDHGTYPFVTSSSTTAGGASAGCGVGPTRIDHVLGIVKAYATRVGHGPFPTELHDDMGRRLRDVGAEFGATTGRPRRCGWLDIPALRLAARLSGIEALALTKLDVLTGIDPVKLCVGYRLGGRTLEELPMDPDDIARVEPIYEELPGWEDQRTGGAEARPHPVSREEDLPAAARRYVARISELADLPFSLISVGPGREETLVKHDPFQPDSQADDGVA